ncbi:hypothetical protein K438DRAFT_1946385 [Mycena galopus ATCC 62051]|nr:hypothetical protein K438DRAFT_1946385 [Mycena galopus ATCC 62051]
MSPTQKESLHRLSGWIIEMGLAMRSRVVWSQGDELTIIIRPTTELIEALARNFDSTPAGSGSQSRFVLDYLRISAAQAGLREAHRKTRRPSTFTKRSSGLLLDLALLPLSSEALARNFDSGSTPSGSAQSRFVFKLFTHCCINRHASERQAEELDGRPRLQKAVVNAESIEGQGIEPRSLPRN